MDNQDTQVTLGTQDKGRRQKNKMSRTHPIKKPSDYVKRSKTYIWHEIEGLNTEIKSFIINYIHIYKHMYTIHI